MAMTATMESRPGTGVDVHAAAAPRLILAGAAPDTGNLGVSALSCAMVEGLLTRIPRADLTVFDFGRGLRWEGRQGARGHWLCGAKHSRRLYRPETMWNIRVAAGLGGLRNPAAQRLLTADAVLDISGGDSFSDLYGPRRFRAVALTKLLALEHKVPLILLPQTYGPFSSARARGCAAGIAGKSVMAWARDERSFAALRSLLGDRFDPALHASGVDVAFSLRAVEPRSEIAGPLKDWVCRARGRELVGINVSGLLFNNAAEAGARYGLRADYRGVMIGFVRKMLAGSDADVMLTPHVVTPRGHYESDVDACEVVREALGDSGMGRVAVAPALGTPGEVKWLIARTDWFCGTRMHATIAALSSGIPSAAVAYSPKALGVFECCGQGEHVVDPRALGTEEVVERLWWSWNSRGEARRALRGALPAVLNRAERQMDRIAGLCVELSAAGKGRGARA